MTLEEALPLMRSLSATDKLRLIDELARELLAERGTVAAEAPVAASRARSRQEPPDPADEPRWTAWLDTLLDAAAERIAATQRELMARGIIDDEGHLITTAVPADMLPGSKTSVTTG